MCTQGVLRSSTGVPEVKSVVDRMTAPSTSILVVVHLRLVFTACPDQKDNRWMKTRLLLQLGIICLSPSPAVFFIIIFG